MHHIVYFKYTYLSGMVIHSILWLNCLHRFYMDILVWYTVILNVLNKICVGNSTTNIIYNIQVQIFLYRIR